jgi:WD40 repeat protein
MSSYSSIDASTPLVRRTLMFIHRSPLSPTCILLTILELMVGVRAAPAEDVVSFAEHVAPIFQARCVSCHDADSLSGGLDLRSHRGTMAGGSSGKVVLPGDPDQSRLFRLVSHAETPRMPPEGPRIPDAELRTIRQWIQGGAAAGAAAPTATRHDPPAPVAAVATPRPAGQLDHKPRRRRPSAITALAASGDGRFVAVAGQREVLLYEQSSLAFVDALPFPEGVAYVLRFSPQSDALLAGGGENGRSGRVVIWSMYTGERLLEVGDESDVVLAADLSPDQTMVALGGPKRKLKVYSTVDGALLRTVDQHSDWITSIAYSPDGVLLASADRSGKLFLWESLSGQEYATLAGHAAAINHVAWRDDANVVASAGEDGQVKLWDVVELKQNAGWQAHAGGARGVAFAAAGRVLLTCGRDKTIKSWNADGTEIKTLHTGGTAQLQLAITSGQDRVVAGDLVGTFRSIEYATGVLLAESVPLKPDWQSRLVRRELAESTMFSQAGQPRADVAGGSTPVTDEAAATLFTAEQAPAAVLPVILPPAAAPVSLGTIEPTVPAAQPPVPAAAISKVERRRLRKKYMAAGAGIGAAVTIALFGVLTLGRRSLRRPIRSATTPSPACDPRLRVDAAAGPYRPGHRPNSIEVADVGGPSL